MTGFLKRLIMASGVAACVAFPHQGAVADEVVLDNGSVITGTVVKLENGALTMSTPFSEPVVIRASKISRITTDSPVEVRLKGKELLKGTLSSTETGRVEVSPGNGRGAVTISWDEVEALNPPRGSSWTGSISVGAATQSGNTDRTSVTAGGEAERKSETDRATFNLLYNYADEAGELTARNIYGALKYDYFFTEKFYGYAGMEISSDRFKDIRSRTVFGPGVGYQLWDDSVRSLLLELGAAYFTQDLYEGADDSWATARAAASLKWRFSRSLSFGDKLVGYSRIDDLSDFQLRNEASVITALSAAWSMKLTNIIEYDSDPSANVEETDTYWVLALQYSF